MKNLWSILCSKSVVDSTTNQLSLFDCIDEITINFSNSEDIKKPTKNIPINFEIVSLWLDEDISQTRKFDYTIDIIDPEGKMLKEITKEAVIEKSKKRLRTIMRISGMAVTTEGKYTFKIKYKEAKNNFIIVSEIPVDIKFIFNIKK